MKQDRKLLSKQKHEIAYVRKIARNCLKYIREVKALDDDDNIGIPKGYVRRLSQAVLKFARYKK